MGFNYKPTPTGTAFHESDADIKMIMGPFGSGKSTIAIEDILCYSMAQPVSPADNTRYTRWGVIRASYTNLKVTTRRTVMEVMPENCGHITVGDFPLRGIYKFDLSDRTHCQVEFDMWAASNLEEAEKFRSANWTGVWINEATEVSFDVMTRALVRCGRFPTAGSGGCRWGGVLLDFNRPPKGHWIYRLFEKPDFMMDDQRLSVASFSQPPAAFLHVDEFGKETFSVNPEAENLENLRGGPDYYARQIILYREAGRTDEVKALYCLLETDTRAGRPVWPAFSVKKHVALQKIEPVKGSPVIIGCDPSGIHPAAVLSQYLQGRWCILDELTGNQEGLDVFMNSGLIPLIRSRYAASEVTVVCDPANARDAFTGLAPTTHLHNAGFTIAPRTTNRPETRIGAVAKLLNIDVGGLLISPHCELLIEAMKGGDGSGGYHYRKHRLRGAVEEVYGDTPEKNEASHLADSLQYLALHINRDRQDGAVTREDAWRERRLSFQNSVRRRIMAH
jgi:hypothetical protein